MITEIDIPFTEEELLQNLPAQRSPSEMPARYRELFQECMQEYRDSKQSIVKELADLTISLSKGLKEGFQNVAVWVDSLIPNFDSTQDINYAYATRAIGQGAGCESVSSLSFEKLGEGCSMSIDIEIMSGGADLIVRLLDDEGKVVLPFFLSARDAESGEVLLQNREFTSGAAKINGVERGRYELTSFSNQLRCDFTLSVE